MVDPKQNDGERKVADNAASLTHFAEVSAKLFAEQAAAMAMMTAYGMSVTSQMASMFLGAMRAPVAEQGSVEPVSTSAKPETAVVGEPKGNVVPLRPVKAKTAMKPDMAKTAAKTEPKKVVAQAAPKKAAVKTEAKKVATKAAQEKTQVEDDLKQISGIGPRLEKVLNARGIVRFADVAKLDKAAMQKIDDELGLEGRVVRDDWAGQAKALSGGKG